MSDAHESDVACSPPVSERSDKEAEKFSTVVGLSATISESDMIHSERPSTAGEDDVRESSAAENVAASDVSPTPPLSKARQSQDLEGLSKAELLEKLQRLMGIMQRLKVKYDERGQRMGTLTERVTMLQAELVKQRSDDDAGSASSSSQKQALASLELEDYKRTVDILKERLRAKDALVEHLRNDVDRLGHEKNVAIGNYCDAQDKLLATERELSEERVRLAELVHRSGANDEAQEKLRSELKEAAGANETMQQAVEEEKLKFAQLTPQMESLRQEVADWRWKASELEQAKRVLSQQRDKAAAECATSRHEFEQYKAKAHQNVLRLRTASDQHAGPVDDSRSNGRSADLLELELRKERERNESLMRDNSECKEKLAQLRSDFPARIDEVEQDKASELSSLKLQYDEVLALKRRQLENRISSEARLTDDVARLSEQLRCVEHENERLQRRVTSHSGDLVRHVANGSAKASTATQTMTTEFDSSIDDSHREYGDGEEHETDTVVAASRGKRSPDVINDGPRRSPVAGRRSHDSGRVYDASDADDYDIHSLASASASRSRTNRSNPHVTALEDVLSPMYIETSMSPAALPRGAGTFAVHHPDDRSRWQNLTELLSESEALNKHLSEQVTFLKEEVRRLEAQSARMDHAHNMEYLKNVLLQFLTHESAAASQREALVEVLSTMLKLTRKEREVLLQSTASPSATSPNGAARAAHELTGFLTRWTGK